MTLSLPYVPPIEKDAFTRVWADLNAKTKPPGSLGQLEELAARLFALHPMGEAPRAAVVLFAADHGVAEEGVSAYPQEVTMQMLTNFSRGGAAINALCGAADADLYVVDVGTHGATPPGVRDQKIRRGSANMTRAPAMSLEDTEAALGVGLRLADELAGNGYDLIGLGEMGIGNTTSATALTAALLQCPVERVLGNGTGISDRQRAHKGEIVERALRRHGGSRPPLDWLARVGGLELAALVGLALGAAHHRRAVVLDGFITGAAALAACRLVPTCVEYCFASHLSAEPGHALILEALALKPLLRLDLRLGEGSGAALSLPLFRAAAHVYHRMATFESAGVSRAERGELQP